MLHNSCSDSYPDLVVKSNGFFQVRHTITEREVEEMDGKKRTVYDYEYAETYLFEYGAIVDAIINTHYEKDSELALINKALADPTSEDYAVYNAFRAVAKQAAKDAIAFWEAK